jgi:hypothetical protein
MVRETRAMALNHRYKCKIQTTDLLYFQLTVQHSAIVTRLLTFIIAASVEFPFQR